MVQFGKTLNDVVKSDWKCHAVAYMELKRALSEQSDTNTNPTTNNNCQPGIGIHKKCAVNRCIGNNDDVHSVHTESSYQISDKQKANYFRIYEDSIKRLTNFYENRVTWANDEKIRLLKAVERRITDCEKNCNTEDAAGCSGKSSIFRAAGDKKPELSSSTTTKEDTTDSTSFLIHQITNFSRDLGLVLEFLELNTTAFSKIMKKYDKRTGSILRESKLKELKNTHPYLYDGGELKKIKVQCTEWIKQLQLILQKDVSMVVSHLRVPLTSSSPSSRVSPRRDRVNSRASSPSKSDSSSIVRLTEQNSFESGDATEDLVNVLPKLPFPAGNSTEAGENPQESSEQLKGAKSSSAAARVGSPTVRFAADEKKKKTASPHLVKPSLQVAPRSIHKTKEAQILEQMIDRVNEELCYQKADSPFFDTPLANEKQPPSFMSSEVQIAALLGQGEFCKIYEVSQFNVPESCHICFLHRGYNDPQPKSLKMKSGENKQGQPGHRKIPSSVIIDTSDISDEAKNVCIPVLTGVPIKQATQQQPTTERWTTFNDDISDYEDLEDDHEDDGFEHTTRGFMKDHCLRNGEARYAIKRIRSCLVGEEEITDAAIDLAREAEFLAALVHPNIIRIRGTINIPGHPKYAIILDRLYDTLEVQMRKWAVEVKSYQGKLKGLIGKNKRELKKKWTDRLVNAYDLARAMAYMHSRGILHRDIKPQNIGFDIRGDIKIFDFGLAKELKPVDKEGKDQFHTSGLAGTRRYMAPEVAQVMPYGLSSDVYSYAILLWEMLALKNAFEKYSREKHYKEVIVEGKRPKLVRSWPFATKNLLERCWDPHPLERPTFQAICELIKFALPNTLEDSARSEDLMLRSYRSTTHHQPRKQPDDDSDHDPIESEIHSDSLSQSIRIKHKDHVPKVAATPKTPIEE